MPFETIAIFCFLFHEKGEKDWQKEAKVGKGNSSFPDGFHARRIRVGTEPGVGGFCVRQAQFSVKQSVPVRINKKSNLTIPLCPICTSPNVPSSCRVGGGSFNVRNNSHVNIFKVSSL